MTEPLILSALAIHGLRNLRPVELEFSPGINLITGANGQGKTSLLEAITVLGTSRSFRTESLREVVQRGENKGAVRGRIQEGDATRNQRVVFGAGARQVRIDDKPILPLANYAARTPIVVFSPADLQLVAGPASLRRTLLSRLGLYLDPRSAEDRLQTLRALKERQLLLEDQGVMAPALGAYEKIAAERGAAWSRVAEEAAQLLTKETERLFASLAPSTLVLSARYQPGGCTDPSLFAKSLVTARSLDRQRRKPTFGPQRDEVEFVINQQSARHNASQGQQRLLALAVKLGELSTIERARQLRPILLLDDVSSELDRERTLSVRDLLDRSEGQVFVTTARPDLLLPISTKAQGFSHFEVVEGKITQSLAAPAGV